MLASNELSARCFLGLTRVLKSVGRHPNEGGVTGYEDLRIL